MLNILKKIAKNNKNFDFLRIGTLIKNKESIVYKVHIIPNLNNKIYQTDYVNSLIRKKAMD